jgi:hypothetical protein
MGGVAGGKSHFVQEQYMSKDRPLERVKISFGQALKMLGPYAWAKVVEQIKTVALIVCYLVVFQLLVLGLPVADAFIVALGIGLVVLGLAFFLEGLFLGLMPLGEVCGVRLPQKTVLPVILIFAFILGLGATFAEPAIGVLRAAGSSVAAWDAPLLFLLLNKLSGKLVWAVGGGVGVAVLFGMLRFLYGWSLKPFIYILYAVSGGVSIWAFFDPNLLRITGLAWDCGAVTTGPVTVPLVLALGIGISRVASKSGKSDAGGGFGVVTLASAFPILAVMGLGIIHMGDVPKPMSDVEFCESGNREQAQNLFTDAHALKGYVLRQGSPDACLTLFAGDPVALNAYILKLATNDEAKTAAFGSSKAFERWLLTRASSEHRLLVYGSESQVHKEIAALTEDRAEPIKLTDLLVQNGMAAIQAIIPLSLFLILVLVLVLRERVRRVDEMILGILFAVIGMSLFSLGIELGLSRLGGEIGTNLPMSFKAVELNRQREVIRNFDPSIVSDAITSEGAVSQYFQRQTSDGVYEPLPYVPQNFDPSSRQYSFTPIRGPLFSELLGILVVIGFGFMMGYGATLAEPALNALGTTVEVITIGTFRKTLLMQAVAIGVGIGIAFGVAKIVFDWPLIWMLVPPYTVLMVLTVISSEDFVNIGWDSAGVTTGPVTVPLVLAMGLGISGQVESIEGFGILALASVWPVLAVLIVGLGVTRRRKAEVEESARTAT